MVQQRFDWEGASVDVPRLKRWPPALEELSPGWRLPVASFFASAEGQHLSDRLRATLDKGVVVYPPDPLRALQLTALEEVRVVILGQDPYHGPGQAEGLAFSVAAGVKIPPSLRNIFKELQRSLDLPMPSDGSLARWARQGVLLLNTSLTVEQGQAASHARWGWETLTDALMAEVAAQARPVVFMLWGGHAQAKRGLIERAGAQGRHLVLQANHPSPLSALRPPQPFIGCNHFRLAQDFLRARGQKTIDW
ncbi:MAG: uracil-DNA glycosylase [Limnohabitans sp.]